jgi:transposase-like protein
METCALCARTVAVDNEDLGTGPRQQDRRRSAIADAAVRSSIRSPDRRQAVGTLVILSSLLGRNRCGYCGVRLAEVARKYAISSGLLYTWRQQVLGGQISVVTGSTPSFARVELPPALQPPESSEPVSATVPSPPPQSSRPDGLIEIVLPSGVLVRVDAEVDGRALRRVLGILDDR